MDSPSLARAMRLSVADGALATVMGSLTTGVFLTGLALALDATRLQIGILAAIPALANVMQLTGSYLIERHGRRKRLCLVATTAARLLWLLVVAVPFLPIDLAPRERVWIVVGLLIVASSLGSIGGVAWLSWTKDLIPEPLHIRFFSRRNQLNSLVALALSIGAGLLLDLWQHFLPGTLGGYVAVLLFALAAGVGSLVLLAMIPEPAEQEALAERKRFTSLVALPWREPNFRRVVFFYASWNLAVHIANPFYGVFMLQRLQLPFWAVTGLATMASVLGLAANGAWTRLACHFGVKPIVLLATVADAFVPLLWLFVGKQTLWLLVLIHVSGMLAPPLAWGPNNLTLKLAPRANASAYLAMYGAVVGPATALASVLGGALAVSIAPLEWSIGSVTAGELKVLFLLSFCGRLLSLVLLTGIDEQGSVSLRYMITALRRARSWQRANRSTMAQTSQPVIVVFGDEAQAAEQQEKRRAA